MASTFAWSLLKRPSYICVSGWVRVFAKPSCLYSPLPETWRNTTNFQSPVTCNIIQTGSVFCCCWFCFAIVIWIKSQKWHIGDYFEHKIFAEMKTNLLIDISSPWEQKSVIFNEFLMTFILAVILHWCFHIGLLYYLLIKDWNVYLGCCIWLLLVNVF